VKRDLDLEKILAERLSAFSPVLTVDNDAYRLVASCDVKSVVVVWPYLIYGLLVTWVTGIGRYWDNPRAELWQYFGLGSVAYVFTLAAILWLLIAPLKPRNWSYRNVLIFITLTSLPALLYAIPVEKFYSLSTAARINVWFLAIVASWRVALLFRFLRKAAGLSGGTVVIATLLPLALIVTALAALNLEHVVFRIMAGVRPEERSANDSAYFILVLITWFSFLASPLLLLGYVAAIFRAHRKPEEENSAA
jgi:hypothetical protein